MKGIFSLFILLVSAASCYAQDAIYFKDGRKEFGKVLEVRENSIVFVRKSNPDGPTYEEYKNRIRYVNYGDTLIERFTRTQKAIQVDSTNLSHKGLYIGLWSHLGLASINEFRGTSNIGSGYSYSGGYVARYILNKHLGVSVGMIYFRSESNVHKYYAYQYNNAYHYSNENSRVFINCISFPVLLTFITGNRNKISFNPELGCIAGAIISGYKRDRITNEINVEGVRRDASGSFYIALNTSFPVSKKISFTIGPYLLTGTLGYFTTSSYGGVFKLWFKL